MRFSLIDLLVATACMTLGFLGGDFIAVRTGPWAKLLGLPLGALLFLIVTPPLYRRFRLPPLLLPRCPHCHKRPDLFWFKERIQERDIVACGLCGGVTELQYRIQPPHSASDPMPRLLLVWPQSIGRWRVVPPCTGLNHEVSD